MRRLGTTAISLFAAIAITASFTGTSLAEERVGVRVGEHNGFARLVFDWPSATGYEARIEERTLVIDFAREGRFDLSRLSDLETYIKPPQRELLGKQLSIPLLGDWTLKHFPLESRVVIDLLGPGVDAQSAVPNKAPTEPDAIPAAQSVETQPASPAVEEQPVAEPALSADRSAAVVAVETLGQAAPAPSPEGPDADAAELEEPTSDTQDDTSPLQLLAPQLMEAVERAGLPVENLGVTEQRREETERGRSSVPSAEAIGGLPQALIDLTAEQVIEAELATLTISRIEDDEASSDPLTTPYFAPARLLFDWQEEVALAAFQRGHEVWLAFKAVAPPNASDRLKELLPGLLSVERLDPPGATVLRLEVPPLIEARVAASDDDWLLDLRHQPTPLETRLSVDPIGEGETSRLSIALEDASQPLYLDDLERGGQVALIGSSRPGQALAETRRYPGLALLASLQGVVVQLDDPEAKVASGPEGVSVSRPGGLFSLPPSQSAGHARRAEQGALPRLFDLPAWRRGRSGEFERVERQLQSEIAASEAGDRLVARVELAKFYFAHGFTDEALGVLQLLEGERHAAMLDPELLLLTAASHILRQDYEKGARLLGHPSLAGEGEARLWEGLLAAEREDWPLSAYRFNESYRLIEDYMPPVRTRLFLKAAEAAAAIGDKGEAMRLLRRSEEEELGLLETAQHDYVLGRILLEDEQEEEGRKLLRRLAAGRHGYPSVKARLALIDAGLNDGSLSMEDAIVQLEQLRFAWRGDAFEFALLKRIADMNESMGRYRETLRTLRSAAAHFPHLPEHDAIGVRMSNLFSDIFLGDRAEDLPPLAALSLYEEFRELSPGGEDGSRLVGRLADRLIEVDLLGRATELLEEQISFRLSGPEKARVGSRLALIYLLDRQPREALGALDRSATDGELPLGLDRQRIYLRAHALLELDRGFDALALIEDDVSKEAERIRIEIHWRLREWDQVADLIRGSLPDPSDHRIPSEAVSGEVLSLAVALTLGDEPEALTALQREWGAAMAKGPHAEAFALLSGNLSSEEVGSIARQLAKIKQAQAFMTSYREDFGEPEDAESESKL